MNPTITLTKSIDPRTGEMNIHVKISCNKTDALELLAYGSKSVRECLGINMMDYLEAIVDARENPTLYRTIIDTSLLAGMEEEADS